MALIKKSAPSGDRPRVSEEHERRLREADKINAACYASMEDLTDRLARARVAVETDDAVPDEIMWDDEVSTVQHVERTRRRLAAELADADRKAG